MQETAPVDPVVETQPTPQDDELLTEEEVAYMVKSTEQQAAKTLKAEVKSEDGKAAGKITIPQAVLAAIGRHLKSPNENGFNRIYKEGGATIDQEQTDQFKDQVNEIRDAYHNVIRAGSKFLNTSTVLIRAPDADGDTDTDANAAEAQTSKRQSLLPDVIAAMDEFVDAVGGAANANAIMAVIKNSKEKQESKDSTQNVRKMDFAKSLFGTSGARNIKSRRDYATKADSVVSGLFAAYKDGTLDENYDIAPRHRVVRPNKDQKAKNAKSTLVDDLSEKSLKDAYDKGYIGNNVGRRGNYKGGKLKEKLAATKGLVALVNRAADSGSATVTSRMFSKMIRRVLESRAAAGVAEPTIVFEGDQGSYDPATDTITIPEETGAEVVIHEVLHALLQGYVYRNRSNIKGADAAVVKTVGVLKNYVKQIINTDLDAIKGMNTQDKAQAAEVISVLRGISNRGGVSSEIDAVLELISYGNTLRGFKILLDSLPQTRNKAGADWKANIRGAWKAIQRVLRQFVNRNGNNISESAAADVLDATVELLQKAEENPTLTKPIKKGASTLYYGSAKVDPNLKEYGTESTYGITKPLFMAMKRMLPEGAPAKIQASLKQVATDVTKKLPYLERATRMMNPHLAFGQKLKDVFSDFKTDKHTGVQLAELVSTKLKELIETDLPTAKKYIAYLDGDKQALNDVAGGKLMAARADELISTFDTYKSVLPKSFKDFFGKRKFSESLLFVEKESDIGSGTPGQRKLSRVVGENRIKREENLIPEWVGLDTEGAVLDTDADYYQVVGMKEGRVDPTDHQGFVRADIAEANGGEVMEDDGKEFAINMNSGKWNATPHKGGNTTFTANKSVREALETMEAAEAASQIGIAILNTANTLGTYYASNRYISSLSNMGRNDDGTIDYEADKQGEVPVAFNSVKELNEYLEKTAERDGETFSPVPDNRIVEANAPEIRSGALAGVTRVTSSYVRMPDTQAMKDDNIPIKIWGSLAGKVVSGPVYAAMRDMSSNDQALGSHLRNYNAALRQFKLSKTVRNPGTHLTNVASNVTLMMAHGIQFKTAATAAKLLYKASAKPESLTKKEVELITKFEASGALLGNFSATEVKQNRYESIRKVMTDSNDGDMTSRVLGMINLEGSAIEDTTRAVGSKAMRFDKRLLELYAAEDNVFRMAAFMTRAGQLQLASGETSLTDDQWKEAGKFGRESFLNYDIDAVALNFARQTIMPFASWTYAVVPVLTKIALTKPWMIANVLTSYAMIDGFMSALAGDDEEKRKLLGDMYNDRLFGTMGPHSMIRIPFMGDDENPVYWKLGDYIPLSSTMRGMPGGAFGYENWPGGLAPNGPLVTIASSLFSVDPYTGKKTSKPTDTVMDTTMRNVGTLVDIFAPPVTSANNWKKVDQYLADTKTITGQDMSGLFLARAFGLKFYEPNMGDESVYRSIEARGIKRDYGMAISKVKRSELRKGAPDYDQLSADLAELRKRKRDELDELYNGKD